ncbi:phosphoglycerate mutase [Comamonas sp. B-9]|uniref:phosphoglycerate mutase n=1 Tax=Comamonas sp. B-9 TaxID=1055192 RepID=UPI0003955DBF|nr:phosphoglycerate mutase [Comamonas sp. B-9]
MSENQHLIISYAATDEPGCQQALQTLLLPNLQRLLRQWSVSASDNGALEDFAPPHERVLAQALGLPPKATPWAALYQLQNGQTPADAGWAFLSPCHWQISPDQVRMSDLSAARMSDDESRSLLAIMAPWFTEDGIALVYDRPDRWLARGAVFAQLDTAALDRIALRDVRSWQPDKAQAAVLQRLQTEMQMLLYTHAFSDAREASGRAPINSFWVHGAGALPAGYQLPAQTPVLNTALRDSALVGDWRSWQQQWQQLDATLATTAWSQISLCGEKNAITLAPPAPGWLPKIKQWLAPTKPMALLSSL